MPILTHGSDLTLAPAIRPIVRRLDGTVQAAAAWLADNGFQAAQMDATLPGVRPRDLDQRARRDLGSLFVRRGLRLAGVDLFIPRRHYVDPAQLDRALSATLSAIELAADLGRLPVSLTLPVAAMSEESRRTLVECADGRGVRLAVHAEDQVEALEAWVKAVDLPALGAALDPAAALARGTDPVALCHRLSKRLAVARLNDLTGGAVVAARRPSGTANASEGRGENAASADDVSDATLGRLCPVGQGDLDVASYRIALDLAVGRSGPVVLDVSGVDEPLSAAMSAKRRWERSAFTA